MTAWRFISPSLKYYRKKYLHYDNQISRNPHLETKSKIDFFYCNSVGQHTTSHVKHRLLTWSLLLCWQTNFLSFISHQPISSRRNSISFCCYLHHQFYNRLRLRAGHYKISVQQQALSVGCNFIGKKN